MGVETVSCPTCGAEVRIGIPRGSEVLRVEAGAEKRATDGTKVRPLTCPDGHEFAVAFTIG
jgi:hypothetical protein